MKQSQRTKNRLREHKSLEAVRKANVWSLGLGFDNAILFKCGDCDWLGWLPVAELP